MLRLSAFPPCLAPVAALALTACTYGEAVDRSGVEWAVLLPDRSVAIAFKELVYRPATGAAAWPDGGVPQYLRDRELIAILRDGAPPRVLQRIANGDLPDSESISLSWTEADPDHLLAVRGAQRDTSSGARRITRWRIDWRDGTMLPFPDVEAELRARGRTSASAEFGGLRILDPAGTLLVGAQASGQDEVWVREANGDWRRIDAIKHFYGVLGDELYYWSADDAALVRNWRTGATRVIARYDPSIRQTTRFILDDPTVRAIDRAPLQPPPASVRIADDRRSLVVREADGTETVLPVPVEALKR